MYEINKVNYQGAIELIDADSGADSDTLAYRTQLADHLTSTIREQKKVELILASIRIQLESLSQ